MADIVVALLAAGTGLLVGWRIGRAHHRTVLDGEVPDGDSLDGDPSPSVVTTRQRPAPSPPRADHDVRILRALDDLRLGVVVLDGEGAELYRNQIARQYATRRHGHAIVDAALDRVAQGARIGLALNEEIVLYGPPMKNLMIQATPVHDDGPITGVVAVIEDVTDARHMDRVRSDFVANVSHELRTPVGAMSLLAEALSDNDDPVVARRLTDRIQGEADRLVQTIDDLLILSRLESGTDEASETTDLLSIARMAIDRVTETAMLRSVSIEIEHEFDGPILVDVDQGQLVSAVVNLLENAVKYSDVDATVIVRLGIDGHLVETEDGSNDPVGTIAVIDSGIGIPERDLSRIFERFYRVDTARSRETGGTGLGLSIVRHAVMNHGGSVTVDSVEGRGSTFTIGLPLSPAQLQTEPLDVDGLLPAGNGRSAGVGDEGNGQ